MLNGVDNRRNYENPNWHKTMFANSRSIKINQNMIGLLSSLVCKKFSRKNKPWDVLASINVFSSFVLDML